MDPLTRDLRATLTSGNVRYLPGTYLTDDPAFCAEVHARMMVNLFGRSAAECAEMEQEPR